MTIGALNEELASLGLRFAPDPTSENDATIGGAIACNASGARSLRYGATRPHVRGVKIVNGDADVVELRRPRLEKNTVGFHARAGSGRLDRRQRRHARRRRRG